RHRSPLRGSGIRGGRVIRDRHRKTARPPQRRLSTGDEHNDWLFHIPRRACFVSMKKKMSAEIQANLPIAQSPSLATLRFFLLQAGSWAVIERAVRSFRELQELQ